VQRRRHAAAGPAEADRLGLGPTGATQPAHRRRGARGADVDPEDIRQLVRLLIRLIE
jgi:hypothetical protein